MEKEKINVYLDDKRDCPVGYVIARTVEDAIELFKNHEVHMLSLDNDLGEDIDGNLLKEGVHFVDYFCEHGLRADKIYIHTSNASARLTMYRGLIRAQERGLIDEDIEIYNYSITPDKYSNNED